MDEKLTAAQIDERTLRRDLEAIVGEQGVLGGTAEMRVYDCDAYTVEKAAPSVVVLPESTEQVAAIIKVCNRLGVPFIPRGAGTGLSGGTTAIHGGVVIATPRMNRILNIDTINRRLTAQAGCVNIRL